MIEHPFPAYAVPLLPCWRQCATLKVYCKVFVFCGCAEYQACVSIYSRRMTTRVNNTYFEKYRPAPSPLSKQIAWLPPGGGAFPSAHCQRWRQILMKWDKLRYAAPPPAAMAASTPLLKSVGTVVIRPANSRSSIKRP